ncbi:protein-lysine N-methyltransferase EEF2KMT-like isoform X1 [Dinothrombium tinctorium]|uniref:Protein-lysine N-methyltransferase EEF2KMT-like isoform X1 n=1 Tax=Dinothrombium tinctorium TaxID=1965070 RepID=A0A443RHD1_9ACAR|nr:protein-lysine N-methyltransferase EEF2KMT-like isoform X1 [Dinothrombium tinctorium]
MADTTCDSLCKLFFGAPFVTASVALSKQFLKKLIAFFESRCLPIHDALFEELASLMVVEQNDGRDFNTYFVGKKSITVLSNRSILMNGTTGLHSWQAGKMFSLFALQNQHLFASKSVVELGSGTGLTGLVILHMCNPRNYLFTDHNPLVIDLIRQNLTINGFNDKNLVAALNWFDDRSTILDVLVANNPDVLIGCDLIFDIDLIPAFCQTLSTILNENQKCKAFIMSTLRNTHTILSFESQLLRKNLSFSKQEFKAENDSCFFINPNCHFILHEITVHLKSVKLLQ